MPYSLFERYLVTYFIEVSYLKSKESIIRKGKAIFDETFTVEEFIIYIGIQDLSFRLHKLNITILYQYSDRIVRCCFFIFIFFF